MKYMMLIYGNEEAFEQASEEQMGAVLQAYGAFSAKYGAENKILGGDGLQPTTTATTVSVRDGKTITTDGPFAETHEQLGGYYLIECDNLDEAIEIAAQIPGASDGRVEVRPVAVYS